MAHNQLVERVHVCGPVQVDQLVHRQLTFLNKNSPNTKSSKSEKNKINPKPISKKPKFWRSWQLIIVIHHHQHSYILGECLAYTRYIPVKRTSVPV
jgi:hypothetical protein